MIRVGRSFLAELTYRVLACVDLGRDAASIFAPKGRSRPWARALAEAYRAAPGRLWVQAMPLYARDLDATLAALRNATVPALADEPGRRLSLALAEALAAERPEAELAWRDDERPASERARDLMDAVGGLGPARDELWREVPSGPPDLEVLDCPSLATAGGTHGRGGSRDGRQVVAVALGAPIEQVLCQVLHEEIHAVTDRRVLRASGPLSPRETRQGTAGFALHQRLEQEAVAAGQRLIDQHAPTLRRAYTAWRRRHHV